MATIKPTVIFQPRTDKLDKPVTVRYYERRKLTDFGDHIEWTDGRKTWKWRLPDQADSPSEYPVLKHILFVPLTNALHLPVKLFRVAFIAEDGALLTNLSQGNQALPEELLDKILPPEAYADLERRGVTRITEEYPTMRALYSAHPDRSLNPIASSFSNHPALWALGFFIVVIVGTLIYSVAAGYFS